MATSGLTGPPLRRRGKGWRDQIMVSLPRPASSSPWIELAKRIGAALLLLLASTLIVWFDRDSYVDNTGQDGISLIDAIYYSTVTITTTGYGDITPLASHARLINALIVTPLRIGFLVLLVGTTLQVLADQGRRGMQDSSWRKRMRNHTVVIGYGTKGRSAVNALRRNRVPTDRIVVIDADEAATNDANLDGLAAFTGDASRRSAAPGRDLKAREVIITLDRDDSAILTTLTVRQLNPRAHIVVSVREHENVPLLRQSGADMVVTSSDAVGRLMGLSSVSPYVGNIIEDLLSHGEGLEVAQRPVTQDEVGLSPRQVEQDRVLGVVRNRTLRRYYDSTVDKLQLGDELVVVRKAEGTPVPVPSENDDE